MINYVQLSNKPFEMEGRKMNYETRDKGIEAHYTLATATDDPKQPSKYVETFRYNFIKGCYHWNYFMT